LRQIHYGMTPENNAAAQHLEAWLSEWLGEYTIEMPAVADRRYLDAAVWREKGLKA